MIYRAEKSSILTIGNLLVVLDIYPSKIIKFYTDEKTIRATNGNQDDISFE